MFDAHPALRHHLVDGLKASPLLAYLVSWFNGVDWGHAGAFVMFVYGVLLCMDKVGLLEPLKAWSARLVRRRPVSAAGGEGK